MKDAKSGYFSIGNRTAELMLELLTPAECKVFLFIYRKTIGWRKIGDKISKGQFVKATKLSGQGVINATNSLQDKNFLRIQKVKEDGHNSYNTYWLPVGDEIMKVVSLVDGVAYLPDSIDMVQVVNSVDRLIQTSQLSWGEVVNSVDSFDPKVVNSVDTQNTVFKNNKTNKTNSAVVVDSQNEEPEPIRTISSDVTRLQGAILSKWSNKLTQAPSDGDCRQAIERFGDSPSPIDKLLEATNRAPFTLKPRNGQKVTPGYALGIVVKWTEHPSWGIKNNDTTRKKIYVTDEAIEMRRELNVSLMVEGGLSGSYDILKNLADLIQQPMEDILTGLNSPYTVDDLQQKRDKNG